MLIDLSPLLRGEHGRSIRVAGVRISDPAANIDRRALTSAVDKEPEPGAHRGRGIRHSTDETGVTEVTVYRTTPDGNEVEVPLTERVDGTLAHGGVLHCGAIALRVTDGVIERIFVSGPSLASLGITREEDIAERFGAATGHERKMAMRVHHYSERGLAITWHDEKRRVVEVELGAKPWHEPRLGAKELLTELVQAYDILFKAGATAPTDDYGRARYQRAAALCRAFGLGAIPAVLKGRFLEDELDTARRRVLDEIAARSPFDIPRFPWPAADVFRFLLRYRHDVDRVVRATADVLSGGDRVFHGMLVTLNELGQQVAALMGDVDRWLCTLMDPEHRTFELRSLIAHHGWPDIDLNLLDC